MDQVGGKLEAAIKSWNIYKTSSVTYLSSITESEREAAMCSN